MIKFDKPTNLNGSELITELKAAGITVLDLPVIDGNGDFWLNINAKDEAKAKPIIESHTGTVIPLQATIADKLASVGLSIDELRSALIA